MNSETTVRRRMSRREGRTAATVPLNQRAGKSNVGELRREVYAAAQPLSTGHCGSMTEPRDRGSDQHLFGLGLLRIEGLLQRSGQLFVSQLHALSRIPRTIGLTPTTTLFVMREPGTGWD